MNAAEFVQHTTIRIETEIPNGISTGTGFLLGQGPVENSEAMINK